MFRLKSFIPHISHPLLSYLLNANLGLTPKLVQGVTAGTPTTLVCLLNSHVFGACLRHSARHKGEENHGPSSWLYNYNTQVS